MNVDTHLNIAGIPDILLVCGGGGAQTPGPPVLTRRTDCTCSWIRWTGRMDGWMERSIVRYPLREKERERERGGRGLHESFRTWCPSPAGWCAQVESIQFDHDDPSCVSVRVCVCQCESMVGVWEDRNVLGVWICVCFLSLEVCLCQFNQSEINPAWYTHFKNVPFSGSICALSVCLCVRWNVKGGATHMIGSRPRVRMF